MQSLARSKVHGVLEVNVHKDEVIRGRDYSKSDAGSEIPPMFDIVTTIFCLEYASESLEEYKNAVRGATGLITENGYLLQGGVLHVNEYSYGGRRFRCHYLTMDHIKSSLQENGMCTDESSGHFKIISHDDIFLLISKKMGVNDQNAYPRVPQPAQQV